MKPCQRIVHTIETMVTEQLQSIIHDKIKYKKVVMKQFQSHYTEYRDSSNEANSKS